MPETVFNLVKSVYETKLKIHRIVVHILSGLCRQV